MGAFSVLCLSPEFLLKMTITESYYSRFFTTEGLDNETAFKLAIHQDTYSQPTFLT